VRFTEYDHVVEAVPSPNLAGGETLVISGALASEIERFFYR
jgi:hypothetical protein